MPSKQPLVKATHVLLPQTDSADLNAVTVAFRYQLKGHAEIPFVYFSSLTRKLMKCLPLFI